MDKINKLCRIVVLISSGFFLFSGCSDKKPVPAEQDGDTQESVAIVPAGKPHEPGSSSKTQPMPPGYNVMVPNPFRDSTADGIRKQLGLDFNLPQGAENMRYSVIAGKTAQIDFDWQGADCTARIEASGATKLQDISGYYYTWQNQAEVAVGYNKAQARWTAAEDGRIVGTCIWWDAVPGIMYSVSMDSNADEASLVELANSVYVQMQGETP